MGLSKYEPFLAQGGKIDPLSEIRNAGIITAGDVRWVSNDGDAQHRVRHDRISDSSTKGTGRTFHTSIQEAIDDCVDDENDYVLVLGRDANASWAPGTAVDMNKSRVHLIGAGYGRSVHGYSTTIEGYAVTVMDDEVIHVTQEGCEIGGLRILGTAGTGSGGTMDNGLLYLSGSATNLWVHDCEIIATDTQWDDDLPVGLLNSADDQHGLRVDNCTIGGTVVEASGTMVPVNQGAESQNWEFHNCKFLMFAGNAGQKFVVAGTGNIDYLLLDNCQFLNLDVNPLVTSAITGDVTDDEGVVLVSNCTAVNVTEFGTDDNCWVAPAGSGTDAAVFATGLSIGTAANVAT